MVFENTDEKRENCREAVSPCKKLVGSMCEVYLPVTIEPYAVAERAYVRCEGEAEICPGHKQCEGNCIEFTISQKINVEIPIKCGAEVTCGEACSELLTPQL